VTAKAKRQSKLPINLEDLLRQRHVEGERIEYKAGWNPDPIVRTLCAFANDFQNLGGGYVIIGQDCDGTGSPVFPPVGVDPKALDKIQQELQTYCNLIQPPYFPLLSVEIFEGRTLLILWAPGGPNRAYKAPKSVTAKKKDYRYFIRRYSSTVEAKDEDERELISLTAKVPFDDRLHPTARVSDFSVPLMKEFLEQVGSQLDHSASSVTAESMGRHMGVIDGPTEAPRPKNVGLLFFNPKPHNFFPATQIDVVWFPEGAGGDRFEEKVFQGPLGRITRDALSFIDRSYLKQTIIKYPDRPEADRVWNFPLAAIEEAVVNAVYHRSYEIREPIEVRISQDDIVVLSFPGPDRSIQLDQLRQGKAVSRRYRNRRIGEFLKELELTEGRSTGISKIFKVMKANSSPDPEFETDDDRSYFLTRLPVHPQSVRVDSLRGPTAHDAAHDTAHDERLSLSVPLPVVQLLEVCQGESSRDELLSQLGLTHRQHFSATYLAPALELGLLEMTLPDKPRSKNQKYRLTPAGKQWLKDHTA
jgi:ATP-dependent DNA helicase RecG